MKGVSIPMPDRDVHKCLSKLSKSRYIVNKEDMCDDFVCISPNDEEFFMLAFYQVYSKSLNNNVLDNSKGIESDIVRLDFLKEQQRIKKKKLRTPLVSF